MGNVILELKNIKKSFDSTQVLNGINLSVEEGEFITLLGSSGCGKTTTIRIIAGLETPDEGQVILDGVDVTNKDPNARDVNTIFQNYALFPHMTVADNIGYGLKIRHRPKNEIREKVEEMLKLVQLEGFEKRRPAELSGGQKQRVAIARALANNPKILLLDEPLGALDLQLRRAMHLELKRLQQRLGITFIYITHDQEEAINMSDRIVVMHEGRFEQVGSSNEVYDYPRTSYVATFVGNANIIQGTVCSQNEDQVLVEACGGKALARARGHRFREGDAVTLAVRSENILLDEDCGCGMRATVKEKTFAAGLLRLELDLENGSTLVSSRYGIDTDLEVGQEICFRWDAANAVPVDLESDKGASDDKTQD